MRIRRMVAVAAVILLGLSGAFLYFDSIFKFGECRIVHLTDVPSPDGSKSVVIYRKECGTTVPYSTHASITSTGVPFSPENASPFFSVRGIQDILVTWHGERIIKVGLIPGANAVYKRDESVGHIRIEYE